MEADERRRQRGHQRQPPRSKAAPLGGKAPQAPSGGYLMTLACR